MKSQHLESLIVLIDSYTNTDPVSGLLWKSDGTTLSHSNIELKWELQITGRWEIKASHVITIKKITATKEIKEPIDEITFH